jgi:hypothetical protein
MSTHSNKARVFTSLFVFLHLPLWQTFQFFLPSMFSLKQNRIIPSLSHNFVPEKAGVNQKVESK